MTLLAGPETTFLLVDFLIQSFSILFGLDLIDKNVIHMKISGVRYHKTSQTLFLEPFVHNGTHLSVKEDFIVLERPIFANIIEVDHKPILLYSFMDNRLHIRRLAENFPFKVFTFSEVKVNDCFGNLTGIIMCSTKDSSIEVYSINAERDVIEREKVVVVDTPNLEEYTYNQCANVFSNGTLYFTLDDPTPRILTSNITLMSFCIPLNSENKENSTSEFRIPSTLLKTTIFNSTFDQFWPKSFTVSFKIRNCKPTLINKSKTSLQFWLFLAILLFSIIIGLVTVWLLFILTRQRGNRLEYELERKALRLAALSSAGVGGSAEKDVFSTDSKTVERSITVNIVPGSHDSTDGNTVTKEKRTASFDGKTTTNNSSEKGKRSPSRVTRGLGMPAHKGDSIDKANTVDSGEKNNIGGNADKVKVIAVGAPTIGSTETNAAATTKETHSVDGNVTKKTTVTNENLAVQKR